MNKEQAIKRMYHLDPGGARLGVDTKVARLKLEDKLRTILKRDGEHEVIRLLLDICEADQVELYVWNGIYYWRTVPQCYFASRVFAIENEFFSVFLELFFEHRIVFSVETGLPLNVRWSLAAGVLKPN